MKKILDLEIFTKMSPSYPKIRHFDIFLKNGSNDVFDFWPEFSNKYEMNFNLNETYFSEKFAFWRYLTSKSSKFVCFLTICWSSKCILSCFK